MIKNKNIDPTANIAVTKIALANGKTLVGDANGIAQEQTAASVVSLADGKMLVGDSNGDASAVTISGDVTISNTGVADVAANVALVTPTITVPVQVLAAAGNSQGTAGAITAASSGLIHATGADGTKGIVLPAAAAGKFYFIKNDDAADAILKVYPNTSDAINAIAADSALSMAAKTAAVFVAIDATTWFTFSLLPS